MFRRSFLKTVAGLLVGGLVLSPKLVKSNGVSASTDNYQPPRCFITITSMHHKIDLISNTSYLDTTAIVYFYDDNHNILDLVLQAPPKWTRANCSWHRISKRSYKITHTDVLQHS